jgi:hypothetical protein
MSNDYTDAMLQYILSQNDGGGFLDPGPYVGKPTGVTAEMARRMNLYQDQLSTQSDMANAALIGPDAFGPGAFDPTSTYSRVDQPGTQALRAYAQRTNTPAGMIAYGILQGSTAGAEIAKLQQMYNEAEADGSLAGDPILSQIPMKPDDLDGTTMLPDWMGLTMQMGDVESKYMAETSGAGNSAMYDPNTGEYLGGGNQQMVLDANGNPILADVETQQSEASQWYTDQGLSPPDQQYQVEDFMDPAWQGQDQSAQQLSSDWYDSAAAMNALYAQLRAEGPTGKTQFAGAAPPPLTKGGDVAAAGSPSSGSNDANTLSAMEQLGQNLGPAPLGSGSPIDMALAAGRALPLLHDPAASYASAGGSGNPILDAVTGAGGWLGNTGFFDGWFNGSDEPPPEPPADEQPQGFMGSGAGVQQLDPQTEALITQMASEAIKGATGRGGGRSRQLMPMGGAPPTPPGGGAITTPADNGGMGPNASAQPPPGGYIHNGAIFDAQGRVVGYTPGAGQMQQPASTPLPMGIGAMTDTEAPMEQSQGVRTPDTMAMLAQILGQVPSGPPQTGVPMSESVPPPAPTPDQQMGPIPGSPEWLAMQSQGFQGWPTATDALSYQNQQGGAPPQPAYNPLPGNPPTTSVNPGQFNVTANGISGGPYIAGPQPERQATPPTLDQLLSIMGQQRGQNSYNVANMQIGGGGGITAPPVPRPDEVVERTRSPLNQSEQPMRGNNIDGYNPLSSILPENQWWYNDSQEGTERGAPPQPAYNPLPQNPERDWSAQVDQYNALGDALRGGAATNGLGFVPQGNDANTLMGMAYSPKAVAPKSWWQENMTPSWWHRTGGDDTQGDQQVRIGTGSKQSAGGKQTQRSRTIDTTVRGPKRARPDTPATRAANQEFWDRSRSAGRAHNAAYGADFGHAAAVAYLLRQRGVTPASTQLAARRGTTAGLGM